MKLRLGRLRSAKVVAGALALAASLAVGALVPGHAFAGLSGCDLDPIVTLSNGAQLTIDTNVADVPGDIQNVVYTLHLPVGVTVTSVSYPDGYGVNESVNAYSDQRWGNLTVSSLVNTGTPGVAVTEQVNLTRASNNSDTRSVTGSASGLSGQVVTVQLSLLNNND